MLIGQPEYSSLVQAFPAPQPGPTGLKPVLKESPMKIILSEQQPIATGATADVYAWGEGRILKLYREGFPPDDARREAERARLAFASGLSMPAVIDVVAVEGRQGVVYERVEGVTMLAALLAQPERCDELAEQMAALHVTMHGCSVSGLPSQRKRLTRAIRGAAPLSETTKQAMLIALDRLPDDGALCHGDF